MDVQRQTAADKSSSKQLYIDKRRKEKGISISFGSTNNLYKNISFVFVIIENSLPLTDFETNPSKVKRSYSIQKDYYT